MGLFTKDIGTMDDLLLHGLKDIYYAENQIVKSLPKLIEKATNRDLSKGLKDHLAETEKQITRIAWAESVGHDDIVRLLNTNLNEEKAADKKLSTVALRKGVNRQAAS